MAVIRSNVLWTSHHVGVDGVDGDYDGNETGSTVDRSAIQWCRLHITGIGDLELQTSNDWGRIWEPGESQPSWYYYPSLMVNPAQDMVIGFSGSSLSSFVGAYCSRRSGVSGTMEGPVLLKAGEDYFENNEWGDYSYTSLDPADGLTIWTVQEYSLPSLYHNSWGTWIAPLRPSD